VKKRHTIAALAVAALAGTAAGAGPAPAADAAGKDYYVACSTTATDPGDGTAGSPWTSLAGPTNHQFGPGEFLHLQRGSTCSGVLGPKGSGADGNPVTIDSNYGDPAKANAIIDGGTDRVNTAAVVLRDVNFWTVKDLTITGGFWRGLWITGAQPNTTHTGFSLSNLDISRNGFSAGNGGGWISGTGGLVVEPCNATTKFDRVTVSHVHTHNTHSIGIQIGHSEGKPYDTPDPGGHSRNTPDCHLGTADMSTPKDGVSNVKLLSNESNNNEESGIWVTGATTTELDDNHLHDNGNVGGLNGEGAWWSNTYDVWAHENYAWANKRAGSDGGGLDADANSELSVIEGNHLYQNDSYCVSVFGQNSAVTSHVVIRNNICTGNGVNAGAEGQGDVYVWAAQGSTVSNVQIYDNVITRSAPGPVWTISADKGVIDRSQQFYYSGNTVTHPAGGKLISIGPNTKPDISLDHNTYQYYGGNSPCDGTNVCFQYENESYLTVAGYQGKHDQNSTFTKVAPPAG
jgi:hypothetical protein